jgi:polyhydroxyalkanoate synthesis regulator phasin
MFGLRRKAAITIMTAIFGTAALGGAALAAFAPAPGAAPAAGVEGAPSAQTERADKLRQVLAGLVAKNVITQAQADAIVAALSDNKGDRQDVSLGRILKDLFAQSATYLQLKPADLRAALPGTSLGAIAEKTKGKVGLVSALTTYANGAIDKAVADGKLTPDLATKAKGLAPVHITKFVERTWPTRQPRPVTPKQPGAAAAPKLESFLGNVSSVAREYLNVPMPDLAAALRSGNSLGDVAETTAGKTRTGLISTIAAAAAAKIDKAQQDGKLTADQATALKASVLNRVTELVNRKGTVRSTAR